MKITVVGTGYVGLVTGTCFAETGNHVTCVDVDEKRISSLRSGLIPFFEPGLQDLVNRNLREERLSFETDLHHSLEGSEVAFVCVGTPSLEGGKADLSYVFSAVDQIAKANPKKLILSIKSTVPVGTADQVRKRLGSKGFSHIPVVSNPEFLREGTAVQDCLLPDRIVLGADSLEAIEIFRKLYKPFVRSGNPIFVMDSRSAELSKYAANSLLAMRISFVNEISMLCDEVGADIEKVRTAMGSDHRIGMQYLFPSVGFGGSCFPKDVRALQSIAQENDLSLSLLESILKANENQKKRFSKRILDHFGGEKMAKGKKIALWGLAFKAKTDDVRESPSLTIIEDLLNAGFSLSVYDPEAMENVRAIFQDRLHYAKTAEEAISGADALCVLTEWNQFRNPDFTLLKEKLSSPVIFDGRNLYNPEELSQAGFTYYSIGRNLQISKK